jgi:hypothetical protein
MPDFSDYSRTLAGAEAKSGLAACHVRRGDHERAVLELRRAVRLGLRDLSRPKNDERWESLLGSEAVRELLGIIDTTDMTRDEGWRADAAFLTREIKRRAYAPFSEISEPEFDAMAARLAQDVPDLSDQQILVGMMRLVRPLGDGHAFVLHAGDDETALLGLPVRFIRFSEGLFITAAAETYSQLVGAQVLSVDGHPSTWRTCTGKPPGRWTTARGSRRNSTHRPHSRPTAGTRTPPWTRSCPATSTCRGGRSKSSDVVSSPDRYLNVVLTVTLATLHSTYSSSQVTEID